MAVNCVPTWLWHNPTGGPSPIKKARNSLSSARHASEMKINLGDNLIKLSKRRPRVHKALIKAKGGYSSEPEEILRVILPFCHLSSSSKYHTERQQHTGAHNTTRFVRDCTIWSEAICVYTYTRVYTLECVYTFNNLFGSVFLPFHFNFEDNLIIYYRRYNDFNKKISRSLF